MRLAAKVEGIKGTLDNDEQKVLLLFSSLKKIPYIVVPKFFVYVNVDFLKADGTNSAFNTADWS